MKIRNENRAAQRMLPLLGLAMALLVPGALPAGAQQSLELPSGQQSGPAYHAPKLTPLPTPPAAQVQTIPMAQQPAPAPPPPPPREVYRAAPQATPPPMPVLPAIFHGCWQGRVDYLDSIERLPGAAPIGPWTPKIYRLCYRRIGSGPFELTFTEAGIAHDERIANAVGKMKLVSSDGRTYATMRALLRFDEYRTHYSYFGGSTFPVDELTSLQCDIEPDGMHVWGQVYGQQSGRPWFRAAWRAVFVHAARG